MSDIEDVVVMEEKADKVTIVVGIIAVFTLITTLYSANEFSGIDADSDYGLNRIQNRLYYVLTTLSSVGYGDIYPVSVRARATACGMMIAMIMSII